MSLKITFRRAARAEFIEAAAWYEAHRTNLGIEFIAESSGVSRWRLSNLSFMLWFTRTFAM